MKTLLPFFIIFVSFFSSTAYSKPLWANHPVIASEGCNSLEYLDVAGFLGEYYYPEISNLNKNRADQQLMETYSMATSLILRSQTCLADALELKELTKELQKQQKLISSGTSMSKKEVEKQRILTAKANKRIKEAANEIQQLSPKQQKSFSLGTSTYLSGTYATAKLYDLGKKFVSESTDKISRASTSLSWSSALNLVEETIDTVTSTDTDTIETLFSGFENHATNLYTTSKFLVEYSKQQNIDLPPDATKELAEVSDWV